jgi:hypothetical protein
MTRVAGYTVYNLTVEGDHTYFVGKLAGGVWVHNVALCDKVLILGQNNNFSQGISDLFKWILRTKLYSPKEIEWLGDPTAFVTVAQVVKKIEFNLQGVTWVHVVSHPTAWTVKELVAIIAHPEWWAKVTLHNVPADLLPHLPEGLARRIGAGF